METLILGPLWILLTFYGKMETVIKNKIHLDIKLVTAGREVLLAVSVLFSFAFGDVYFITNSAEVINVLT